MRKGRFGTEGATMAHNLYGFQAGCGRGTSFGLGILPRMPFGHARIPLNLTLFNLQKSPQALNVDLAAALLFGSPLPSFEIG